jgi:hypothetical protein
LVLKLHGSVDWKRIGNRIDVVDDAFALLDQPDQIAMARPGPSKKSLISSGPFSGIWKLAQDAVENADAVVFVGYRIPDTDAETMHKLIAWLRQAVMNCATRSSSKRLPVHTVLGPEVNGADSKRLRGLLSTISDRLIPIQWPLYAQEFIALIERQRLLDPDQRTGFA